jgi:hypothetical protein
MTLAIINTSEYDPSDINDPRNDPSDLGLDGHGPSTVLPLFWPPDSPNMEIGPDNSSGWGGPPGFEPENDLIMRCGMEDLNPR